MINVTKAYLPSREKYQRYVDRIFDSGWLTNDGSSTQELERRLTEYLGVRHVVLVSNGTLALQVAYRALELKGDVVTTPFSFVATTSSLVWEGIKPVFADIHPESLNIDPVKIERVLNKSTTGIVGVHVYGRGCEVEAIQSIAQRNGLKVVYDGAHAFGVNYNSQSIFNWGDLSTLSFHATKLFHTIEGGAIITSSTPMYHKLRNLINFGITGPDRVEFLGINAKMNEFQAAMGLCILDEIGHIRKERARVAAHYESQLPSSIMLMKQKGFSENNSYFPVLFNSEESLLQCRESLREVGVNTRRYFYPSLDTLPYLEGNECRVSRDISRRILCLPMYAELSESHLDLICDALKKTMSADKISAS